MHLTAPIFTNPRQAAELATLLGRLTESECRLIARRAARLASDLADLSDRDADVAFELGIALEDAKRLVSLAADKGSRADLYAARTVKKCIWIHERRATDDPTISGA